MQPLDLHRHDLEAQAQVLVEIETRQKKFPLYYYEPNAKVQAFHESRKRVRVLSGGNRSGKSHANVAEACAYTLGYRPWHLRQLGLPIPPDPWQRPAELPHGALCFNQLGIRVPVPNEVFIVTGQSMKKGIGETLYPKIKQLIGPFITNEHMAHSGVPADIELKNGSRIIFGSAEQGPLSFESTNYTFSAIDEPVPRRVYTGISRGSIDQYAPIIMTFTPLGAWAGWIFRDIYSPAVRADHPQIDVFEMSIFDNKYLTPEAIAAFAEDPALSQMEKEARLYGRFPHLADVVYPNFREEIHVIKPFMVPRDWFHGMVVDPHSIKPWAILYFAISPLGDVYVHKEWPFTDFTRIPRDPRSIKDYALLIRELDGDLPIQTRLMDPNYGPAQTQIRGRFIPSVRDDLELYGLHFDCRINDDLSYGEGKVRALLHYDPARELDSMNRPHLYITETCINMIQSMTLYTAKPKHLGDGEMEDMKRIETYKDFADCLRYVAVSGLPALAGENYAFSVYGSESYGYGSERVELGPTGYGEVP